MNSNDILVIDNLSKIYHTNNSEITAIKDLNLNTKTQIKEIINSIN